MNLVGANEMFGALWRALGGSIWRLDCEFFNLIFHLACSLFCGMSFFWGGANICSFCLERFLHNSQLSQFRSSNMSNMAYGSKEGCTKKPTAKIVAAARAAAQKNLQMQLTGEEELGSVSYSK